VEILLVFNKKNMDFFSISKKIMFSAFLQRKMVFLQFSQRKVSIFAAFYKEKNNIFAVFAKQSIFPLIFFRKNGIFLYFSKKAKFIHTNLYANHLSQKHKNLKICHKPQEANFCRNHKSYFYGQFNSINTCIQHLFTRD
jgi:hypothetical protein